MSQSICSTGLRWLWLVVVVLIIDLGSKYLILQNFALGDTVPLFPSLNLHYARNYGAAFSFLADSGGWQRWFFAGIAIGISVILMVMMYRSKATQKLNNIAYALIIGGALGNLFDRLWHGFVVDMIDFYVGDWHFATFNLADTAICVGDGTPNAASGSSEKVVLSPTFSPNRCCSSPSEREASPRRNSAGLPLLRVDSAVVPSSSFSVKCTRTALLLCTDSDMQVCSYILRIFAGCGLRFRSNL